MCDSFAATRFLGEPVSFEWKIENYADFPLTVIPTFKAFVDNVSYLLMAYHTKGVKLAIGKANAGSQFLNRELHYVLALVLRNGKHVFQKRGSIDKLTDYGYAGAGPGHSYHNSIVLDVPPIEFQEYANTGCLLNDGCVRVYVELSHVRMAGNITNPVSYYLPDALSTDFGKMFVEKTNADVILTVGGCRISAHTAVLSARSSVFAAMFRHNMLEKYNKTVSIVDVSSTTMHRLLRFIYTGKIEDKAADIANLPFQELSQLYAAADKYAVLGLKDMCSHIMRNKLSTSNLEEFALLAYKHNDHAFQASIVKFISEDKSVFETNRRQQLMSRVPELSALMLKIALDKIKL